MKILVLGGNRFMGLQLVRELLKVREHEVHVFNRSGLMPDPGDAILHKGDRRSFKHSYLNESWDAVYDFCCFNQEDAQHTVEYFKEVKRYIFISTQSVYPGGQNLKEVEFDPLKMTLGSPPQYPPSRTPESYRDGKQRAEAVFFQRAQFPVVAVRFPIVTGTDDYTRRLAFHVERCMNSRPIFLPNPQARLSLIMSQDAAGFLNWSLKKDFTGPINVASKLPIALETMLAQVEAACHRKIIYAASGDINTSSPYGIPVDWFMDVSLCEKLGFQCTPISQWMPSLIEWLVSEQEPKVLH